MKGRVFLCAVVALLIMSKPAFALNCIPLDKSLKLDLPCVRFAETDFSFTLEFLPNPANPSQLLWQLTNVKATAESEGCITLAPPYSLLIPCVEFEGVKIGIDLAYYPNPPPELEAESIVWRLAGFRLIKSFEEALMKAGGCQTTEGPGRNHCSIAMNTLPTLGEKEFWVTLYEEMLLRDFVMNAVQYKRENYPGGDKDTSRWRMFTDIYEISIESDADLAVRATAPNERNASLMLIGEKAPPHFRRDSPKIYIYENMLRSGTRKGSIRYVEGPKRRLEALSRWRQLCPADFYVSSDSFAFPTAWAGWASMSTYIGSLFDATAGGIGVQNGAAAFSGIVQNEDARPWQDVVADQGHADWLNKPKPPGDAPEGYHYVYQGRNVSVDRVLEDSTLPGLNLNDPDDPINNGDYSGYQGSPNDVSQIYSSSGTHDHVLEHDIIVEHVWTLVPNS